MLPICKHQFNSVPKFVNMITMWSWVSPKALCMCVTMCMCVAVFVMMHWKSGVLLIFYFFGSLNSLAKAQNDEMWWKSHGSTLRTKNWASLAFAASVFLLCEPQSGAEEKKDLLWVIYSSAWPALLPVTVFLDQGTNFKGGKLEGARLWIWLLFSQFDKYDLQAVGQDRDGQERRTGSESLWFTGSKPTLLLETGQGWAKCLAGLAPYSSLLPRPWRKPLLCSQPVSDNKCK